MIHSRMLQNRKRSKRFYKYLLSYLAFVAIMLLFAVSLVNNSLIRTLRHDVEGANLALLEQIRNVVDMRIKEMDRIAVSVFGNYELLPFKLAEEDNNVSVNAVNEIMKYRSGNEFIYEIGLYYDYENLDRIYTSNGAFDAGLFFNQVYKYENFDQLKFKNFINEMDHSVIRPVETILINAINEINCATYIYPLPPNNQNSYGAIMFMIEENVLKNIIGDCIKNFSGSAYILDGQNEEIVSLVSDKSGSKHNYADVLNNMTFDGITGEVKNLKVNNMQYSTFTIPSDYNDWNYIIAMPTADFMGKINNARLFLYLFIGIVLVLGVIMSYLFADRNYRPLKELVDELKGWGHIDKTPGYVDEIDFINEAINEVKAKNKTLTSKIKSKSWLIKDHLLLLLLNGKAKTSDDLKYMMELSGVTFSEPYYTVLLFLIDDYDNFKKKNSLPMRDIIKFGMVHALEELAEVAGSGYGTDLVSDKGVALILNQKSEYNNVASLNDLAVKAGKYFLESFGFTLTIGIGNTSSDISKVQDSYVEAKIAADSKLMVGNGKIIHYSYINNDEEREYKYALGQEMQQLELYLKQGFESKVREEIRELIMNMKNQRATIDTVNYTINVIVHTLLKMFKEIELNETECLGDKIENLIYEKIETLDDLENRLKGVCLRICEYIESQKKSKNSKLFENILSYVNENYNNNNIYVGNLAAIFNLSDSYITRFFKDQAGYSLKQYIDMLRMEEAKKLLKDTDLLLKEIIDKVGYVDETNFIRKFKKKEGMTPIMYRNVARNDVEKFPPPL